MKKQLLTFFFTLCSLFSIGQNWNLFQADSTYNFIHLNFQHREFLGVKVDSIITSPTDTRYYFNRIVNDTVRNNISQSAPLQNPVTEITQPNIFGSEALQKNDSVILMNQFGTFIYLKPSANLNHSWNLIRFDDKLIVASVNSIYEDSVNYTLDSIKRISFKCYDTNNTALNHKVNAMQLIISKSHGILSSPNFYENIQGSSINQSYKQTYNRIFRSTYFSWSELIELNVGDEYHLRREYSPNGLPDTHLFNCLVINKRQTPQSSTIILTLERSIERRISYIDRTTWPPTINFTRTFSKDTIFKTINNPNSIVDSFPGLSPIVFNDSIRTLGQYNKVAKVNKHSFEVNYINGPISNRQFYTPNNELFVFIDDSINTSWAVDYSYYSYYSLSSLRYLKGVTGLQLEIDNSMGGGGIPIVTYLDYYKVGSETYGNPNVLSSLEVESIELEKALFYPNPAQNKTNINSEIPIKELQIFNINGQLVQQFESPIGEIDLSTSKAGIYLFKAILIDGTVYQEKLIIRH